MIVISIVVVVVVSSSSSSPQLVFTQEMDPFSSNRASYTGWEDLERNKWSACVPATAVAETLAREAKAREDATVVCDFGRAQQINNRAAAGKHVFDAPTQHEDTGTAVAEKQTREEEEEVKEEDAETVVDWEVTAVAEEVEKEEKPSYQSPLPSPPSTLRSVK